MDLQFSEILVVTMVAVASAAIVLAVFRQIDRRWPAQATRPRASKVSFLIQGNDLLDATPEAYALFANLDHSTLDGSAVVKVLGAMFPSLADVLASGQTPDTVLNAADGSPKYLRIRSRGDALSLSIEGPQTSDLLYLHQIKVANEGAEIGILREAVEHCNQLMWRTDHAGVLTWANSAYLSVVDRLQKPASDGRSTTLPSTQLFEGLDDKLVTSAIPVRLSVPAAKDGEEDWYDVCARPVDGGLQYFAADANAIVQSEISQRKFVQTISQTFAQLSIGLAIFDRGRRLSTFNPALIDLTSMPVDFLSSRPSLDMILDRLREMRMLPEPKDYAQWREGFSRLELEARNGTYSENWNLPDGQTYRVTGRPHPDGAFALLFEDISAEISLTRRFRSEIETSQAVLDRIEDAIAVFSSAGNLVMSNSCYESLWENGSDVGIVQSDLRSELIAWKSRCAPTRIWSSLRDFIRQTGPREPWSGTALLDDGRAISCRAEPISGGMTMVRFSFGANLIHEIQNDGMDNPVIRSVKS